MKSRAYLVWGAHAPPRARFGALAETLSGRDKHEATFLCQEAIARARSPAREGACAPRMGRHQDALAQSYRNKRRHFARVIVVLATELPAQKFFLATNAHHRAEIVDNGCDDETEPMPLGQAGGDEHSEHAGVNRMANDPIRAAPYQFVMFENAGLQTPLFAKRAHGCGHENQRRQDQQNGDRSDDVLCTPIDRQKWRERFARPHPGNAERDPLNEDCNDGTRICPPGFVPRSLCHEEENRTENDKTRDHKIQRPKIKPVRHRVEIETKLPCRRELFHGRLDLVMLMDRWTDAKENLEAVSDIVAIMTG
jgi:hypothetical protein